MNDEPREPVRDPNYILSQEEFHESQEAQCRRQLAGEQVMLNNLRHEADGLRETFGWVMISFALWAFLIGYFAIKGQLKGGPRG